MRIVYIVKIWLAIFAGCAGDVVEYLKKNRPKLAQLR